MSVPNSVEELIQLIRKSGMIDEPALTAYLQRRQYTRGLPTDPRDFADDMVRDRILTYFQAEQFMLGKWRGFTIGKYKLLERVGVGGMGQVFLCEHMFMKRRVAVKVLPPAKAEQPAALGRFYREARAAGGLEHRNIVRTQDIDQDGNLHFLVMEYVDGSNLLELVKKSGPMDIARATHYIRQAADGLDYAFRNGIIHRDVKPGNILVDRKGTARILDMGLARFYKDAADQLTIKYDDKIVLGTADYVAPEQVANSHSVDIRADVYGLGATFYFLLAGHPPFPTGTVSQKLLWHRTKEPTPIRQIRPEVPEGLATVLARMMAKDPKARYQTPAQVVAELSPWVPARVPLPTAEEMPQLSPAATEMVAEEVSPELVAEQKPLAQEPAAEEELVAVGGKGSSARATNRPSGASNPAYPGPANPFPSPPAWPAPKSGTRLHSQPPSGKGLATTAKPPSSRREIQANIETATASQPTPSPYPSEPVRTDPFGESDPFTDCESNPFSGGDATVVPPPPKTRWGWVGALTVVLIAMVAFAIFQKVFQKPAPVPEKAADHSN